MDGAERRIYILAQHYGDAEAYALGMLKAHSRSVEAGWRGWIGRDDDGKKQGPWFAQYMSTQVIEQLRIGGGELHVIPGAEKRRDLDEALDLARKLGMPIWWSADKRWEAPSKTNIGATSEPATKKKTTRGKKKAG